MRNLALMWVLAGCLLGCGGWKPSVSTFTDKRDGKVYKIVKIGRQVWFAENLNYVTEGSKCYDNKVENCAKYGRLYSWETAMKACPAGAHLPTDAEWTALEKYIGGRSKAGTKLKSPTGWECWRQTGFWDGSWTWVCDEEAPVGTDEFGFSALPGGQGNCHEYHDGSGQCYEFFYLAGNIGSWWSATDATKYARKRDADPWESVWVRSINSDSEDIERRTGHKNVLNSLRCVLDDEKEGRK